MALLSQVSTSYPRVPRDFLPGHGHISYLLSCPDTDSLCCQQAKALNPKGFFPKFFPDFGIFLFQQSATGTFISIDKFTKFCSRLRTEHYMHMINVMVYYTIDHIIEQVFFSFLRNSSPTCRGRRILAILC